MNGGCQESGKLKIQKFKAPGGCFLSRFTPPVVSNSYLASYIPKFSTPAVFVPGEKKISKCSKQ